MASPAETAKEEAARQAVGLLFGLAAAALFVLVQKKMGAVGIQDYLDPQGAPLRRMEAAKRAQERWDRVSVWCWRFGPWQAAMVAHRRAEAARRRYEAERP